MTPGSRLLLDTHAVLWWFTGNARLPTAVRARIERATMLTISAVALWEIAIKVSTGCLDADLEALGSTISNAGIPMLNPSLAHAIALRDLPLHHRDPFDRLLIAQAQVEGLTLVSADRAFGAYDVPVLWAG